MHWQLFFPREYGNSKTLLEKHGMVDFVPEHESAIERNGPDGGGLLIGWKGSIGYDAGTQVWQQADGQPYWIGISTTDIARPEELQRGQVFSGELVTLDDGQRWQVPVAAMLPQSLRLIDRQWTRVRKPQFDEFWKKSEVWFRHLMLRDLEFEKIQRETGLSFEQIDQEWTDYVVFALRQNYRLTPEVVSRLGLLDVNSRLMVTTSTIEGMAVKEVLDLFEQKVDADTAGLENKVPSTPLG